MMNKITILSIISSLLISQLFYIQSANAAEDNYSIKKHSDTNAIKFYLVRLQNENNQLLLRGYVKRRYRSAFYTTGHIDVVVKDNDNVIFNKTLKSSPARISRHSRFGSSFKVVLPDNLPLDSVITLQWHKNKTNQHSLSSLINS